jgi:hypothetical protein
MRLQVFTFREWSVSLEKVPEIGATALDQMSSQTPAMLDFIRPGEVLGKSENTGSRRKQRTGSFIPAVGVA